MLKYVAAEFQYEACAEFVSRRRQCCECRPRLFLPAVPRLATFVQATAIESYCTGVLTWVGVRGCLHGFSPMLTRCLHGCSRVLTPVRSDVQRWQVPYLAGICFFVCKGTVSLCTHLQEGDLESQRMLVTFTGPWPPDLTVFQNSHIFMLPPWDLGGTKLTHSTGCHLPAFSGCCIRPLRSFSVLPH